MIKNRTAQLVFQTVYCTLGLIGMLANFGIFDDISNLGVAFWFLMIFLVYVPLGYAFFGLDRLLARKKKGE